MRNVHPASAGIRLDFPPGRSRADDHPASAGVHRSGPNHPIRPEHDPQKRESSGNPWRRRRHRNLTTAIAVIDHARTVPSRYDPTTRTGGNAPNEGCAVARCDECSRTAGIDPP